MSLAMLRHASVSSVYAYLHPSSGYERIAPESHSSMLRDNVFGVIVVEFTTYCSVFVGCVI